MRRVQILPVLLAVLAVPAHAQARLHLLVGGTVSHHAQATNGLHPPPLLGSRQGLAVGIGGRRTLVGGLAIAAEAIYAVKGVQAKVGSAGLRQAWLELPVLLRHEFPVTGAVRPHLLAGPTLGWLVACDFNGGGAVEPCDERYGEEESYHRLDAGIMLGAGLELRQLGVSVRYELGWRDINRAPGFVSKNRTLFVLATLGL